MTATIKFRREAKPFPTWWHALAACRTVDPWLFFGDGTDEDVSRTVEDRARVQSAIRVCRECPVRQQCLDHALSYPEPWGVWGGMSAQQRAFLRTRLRKQAEARRRTQRRRDGRSGEASCHSEGSVS